MGKVLLIGGAGYVGSVLTEELLERGYAVRILDRLFFGDMGIKHILKSVELKLGDMRVLEPEIFEGVDAVVNLGGLSNDPTAEYNPKANHEMNTVATRTSAEAALKAGVSRYVFASSCSIYDRGVSDQDNDIIQNEETPVSPRAAYSSSKREAEEILLGMAGDNFCPVILRKGTVYGFSPRMRYDLVVNTFIKSALTQGFIAVFFGGEMWRPMVDVRDVARAYILALEADDERVRGQIFNITRRNYRISELGLRVRDALRKQDIVADIKANYGYKGVRSYRVSGEKAERVLGFRPKVDIEESVSNMVEQIRHHGYDDFDNPLYYNIRWMSLLEQAQHIIQITGSVFEPPK